MNYKFIQPVSMQVTKEQFEYLGRELEKLGYILEDFVWDLMSCYICTNYNGFQNKASSVNVSRRDRYNRYCIDHYNPQLFLALAATTNSNLPIEGEYYITNGGDIVRKDICEVTYWYWYYDRRATKEELIAHFTKKEFVLPEKWCVKRNIENYSILNTYFNNINECVDEYSGKTDGYLHYPAIHSNGFLDHWSKNKDEYFIEITLEQFKKYVLKQDTMNIGDIVEVIDGLESVTGCESNGTMLLTYNKYTFKDNYRSIKEIRGDTFQLNGDTNLWFKIKDFKVIKSNTMNKKIIGYKLIKEYPGSGKIGRIENCFKGSYQDYYPEFWEPVYEEDKKLKIFTLDCKDGKFELEVSTDGILYRPDSAYLDINDLDGFIDNAKARGAYQRALRAKGRSDSYKCQFSHIDLGCKKSVPISQLKEVVDYYNSIK